ncbi:hypothetical protein EDD15DRAFT_2203761 [Pisolithus albus]|nr:hypothetical protein EDD15DRAFT_2203761 [Pisolithus albus]
MYVVAAKDRKTYLALKTSWQDVAHADVQNAIMKRLNGHDPHPNIVIPSSENNTILSLCWGGLGALIDFDMVIIGSPNLHLESPPPVEHKNEEPVASLKQCLLASDESFKAECTGTMPYMSIGVHRGKLHTHYDDVKSYLYVLVLFFFSYKPTQDSGSQTCMGTGFHPATQKWSAATHHAMAEDV